MHRVMPMPASSDGKTHLLGSCPFVRQQSLYHDDLVVRSFGGDLGSRFSSDSVICPMSSSSAPLDGRGEDLFS